MATMAINDLLNPDPPGDNTNTPTSLMASFADDITPSPHHHHPLPLATRTTNAPTTLQPPTPTGPPSRQLHEHRPFASRPRMREAGSVLKIKPKGDINFLPFEDVPEETRKLILKFHVNTLGSIHESCQHIPYNSGKKDFFEKTGRESLEVFCYNFKIDGNEKDIYTVRWDYNVGLVRMTDFFKALKYPKTAPAKMLNVNEGLKDITPSITGGSIKAQGYWMPYNCAKAICANFCFPIAAALIPLFGPKFPSQCLHPDSPEFARWAIDPAIIAEARAESERYRSIYIAKAGTSARSPSSPGSSGTGSPRRPGTGRRNYYERNRGFLAGNTSHPAHGSGRPSSSSGALFPAPSLSSSRRRPSIRPILTGHHNDRGSRSVADHHPNHPDSYSPYDRHTGKSNVWVRYNDPDPYRPMDDGSSSARHQYPPQSGRDRLGSPYYATDPEMNNGSNRSHARQGYKPFGGSRAWTSATAPSTPTYEERYPPHSSGWTPANSSRGPRDHRFVFGEGPDFTRPPTSRFGEEGGFSGHQHSRSQPVNEIVERDGSGAGAPNPILSALPRYPAAAHPAALATPSSDPWNNESRGGPRERSNTGPSYYPGSNSTFDSQSGSNRLFDAPTHHFHSHPRSAGGDIGYTFHPRSTMPPAVSSLLLDNGRRPVIPPPTASSSTTTSIPRSSPGTESNLVYHSQTGGAESSIGGGTIVMSPHSLPSPNPVPPHQRKGDPFHWGRDYSSNPTSPRETIHQRQGSRHQLPQIRQQGFEQDSERRYPNGENKLPPLSSAVPMGKNDVGSVVDDIRATAARACAFVQRQEQEEQQEGQGQENPQDKRVEPEQKLRDQQERSYHYQHTAITHPRAEASPRMPPMMEAGTATENQGPQPQPPKRQRTALPSSAPSHSVPRPPSEDTDAGAAQLLLNLSFRGPTAKAKRGMAASAPLGAPRNVDEYIKRTTTLPPLVSDPRKRHLEPDDDDEADEEMNNYAAAAGQEGPAGAARKRLRKESLSARGIGRRESKRRRGSRAIILPPSTTSSHTRATSYSPPPPSHPVVQEDVAGDVAVQRVAGAEEHAIDNDVAPAAAAAVAP